VAPNPRSRATFSIEPSFRVLTGGIGGIEALCLPGIGGVKDRKSRASFLRQLETESLVVIHIEHIDGVGMGPVLVATHDEQILVLANGE
jgi:hypothetical protein